jgi:hypothetical protein
MRSWDLARAAKLEKVGFWADIAGYFFIFLARGGARGKGCGSWGAASFPGVQVIAEKRVLVSDVHPAVGDDGVGPGGFPGAVGGIKAAALDVAFGAGVYQVDRTLAGLAAAIEAAIGVDDRAFAGLALVAVMPPLGFVSRVVGYV